MVYLYLPQHVQIDEHFDGCWVEIYLMNWHWKLWFYVFLGACIKRCAGFDNMVPVATFLFSRAFRIYIYTSQGQGSSSKVFTKIVGNQANL
mmetsp:Transcript_51/g.79  ORF Transcript_51/g.79 Transcript_51/m.79 type:complete len:91 (+) Transcript_51:476-748(+)